ncbi:MAG: type II CRISPR-associated endonuclease Cas1 [Campylobacterota bacterium]|nr:type II CRISPR-associated endonuclease Cas1 [Campylobacterota bacterium]
MSGKVVHLTKPCKIKVKNSNLVLFFKEEKQEVKITLKDIDFLLFDNTRFSITGKSLELLAKNNIATLFIDDEHHPSSILTPFHSHSTMNEVAHAQIAITQEFKNIMWQSIIKSKINNQADVLKFLGKKKYSDLIELAKNVQPYDKNANEAQSARAYWREIFNMHTFRREQGSEDIINSMLNYSYAILRASIARNVVASGLLPVFGIWHKNKYNSFNLVDDLIEPFRPFCDLHVKKLLNIKYKQANNLSVGIKRDLVNILLMECVDINGGKSTLAKAMELFVKEYKKCVMSGNPKKIFFPKIDVRCFEDEFI